MSDDKIISIREISYDKKLTLEESFKQDVADGLITTTALGSIGGIESTDNYTLKIKQEKGKYILELPEEAIKRRENKVDIEDYFYLSPKQASELL